MRPIESDRHKERLISIRLVREGIYRPLRRLVVTLLGIIGWPRTPVELACFSRDKTLFQSSPFDLSREADLLEFILARIFMIHLTAGRSRIAVGGEGFGKRDVIL